MKEHYLLRKNVLTGVPEYKHRGVAYSFVPLDQPARNTMSINALKAGVDSWDRDLNRYIDSDLIPLYNPLEDYLQHLAPWDGKDRVSELARCVKTDNPHWVQDFHKWMLSMVAVDGQGPEARECNRAAAHRSAGVRKDDVLPPSAT